MHTVQQSTFSKRDLVNYEKNNKEKGINTYKNMCIIQKRSLHITTANNDNTP